MRTLYFDCFAGASGNMILGALVSAGLGQNALIEGISQLDIPEFKIEFETVDRSGISSIHANVIVPHEHAHRHLHHIEAIINRSGLSENVKNNAIAVFTRLAEAEAKVHGIDVAKVHFHEVGAMDAIVDVVGACIGFELLGIESFSCSRIHVGSGFVDMEHGKFPVPPPAVAELLSGIPIYSTEIEGELITPTGAAIIATLCTSYGKVPEMVAESTGYGAGSRSYDKFPNVLRVMIGTSIGVESGLRSEPLILLETNIDDASPQLLSYVMEKAFALSALDCWFTPIQMKKNRPATLLSILCRPAEAAELKNLVYRETTTLGIRIIEVDRECLERDLIKVETQFGPIDVKVGKMNGTVVNAMPEYDQVKNAAEQHSVSVRQIQEAALSAEKEMRAASGGNN